MIGRRALLAIPAVAVLIAACAGGLPALPGSTDGGDGEFTFPVFQGPTNRPSGAQVRVFNAYSPVTSEPGAIDVYGESFVSDDSRPLVSVPYGTLSEFFDPGAMDDDGNAFVAFYPAGRKGSDDQLMSQSFTLQQGEVYTVFVTTARNFDDEFVASTHVFAHHPEPGGLASTPSPGNGLLTVVSTGLDEVLAETDDQWFVSFGSGCEPGLGNEPGSGITSAVSPGQTGATFEIAPGAHTVTIHAQGPTEAPTCTTPSIADGQVEAKADTTDVMLLFAPKAGDLRSVIVPLEP
jgi:hypothetical protein